MKKITIISFLFISFLIPKIAFAQAGLDTSKVITSIEFPEKVYNFGICNSGDTIRHTFTFINTGTKDLIVQWVKPSCGCTTADYTKSPIPPGEEGKIDVLFNTYGREGNQLKFVWVQTNTKPFQNTLTLKGIAKK